MRQSIIYIVLFLLSLNHLSAQKHASGYQIEGDTVVFTFDIRDYKLFTNEQTNVRRNFKNMNVEDVIVSGNFNMWSRDGWQMRQIDKNIYQLKKSLDDFTDEYTWEFKFLINRKYWAEPDNSMPNITPATDEDGDKLYVYNLKFYSAKIDPDGNACFKLHGFEKAKKVVLSGSFNKWDEHLFRMKKTDNGWELTLQLRPGVYEYKFIVDGNWMEDPDNPYKRTNEYSGHNSVLNIKAPVTFHLNGYQEAQTVILTGSFVDWDEHKIQMKKNKDGVWEKTLMLSGGKHHYKFIVDGNWMEDPKNAVKEYDSSGNINSVVMVK